MKLNLPIVMLSCLALSAAITSPRKCGQNEEYSETGGHCQRTCEAPISICNRFASAGCVCKNGYLRDSNKKCIPEHQCPAKCEENEVPGYSDKCEPSCQNRNPLFCTRIGESGCLCKKGYIRSDDTHKCVPESQCPKSVECPANEVFGEIAKGCEPTCENPNPTFCLRMNEELCLCKKGLIRDSKTKKCVKPAQCQKTVTRAPKFTCEVVWCSDGKKCQMVDVKCQDPPCAKQPKCV